MSVRNYHTLNGRIRSETLSGSTTNYAPDALGSTFMTAAASGTPRNYYRFKPYGGFVYQGGPDPDPKFLWTGATGSRVSGAPFAGQYNRARHYGREQAGWTSVDPLWPMQRAYQYVDGNPASWDDPSGFMPVKSLTCIMMNEAVFAFCSACERSPSPGCHAQCDDLANAYYNMCRGSRPPTPNWGRGPGGIGPAPRPASNLEPDPIMFMYGNCCGYERRCGPGSFVMDCLDGACRDHDSSIPDVCSFLQPEPHMTFCMALFDCDCGRDYAKGSADYLQCVVAKGMMMGLYCTVGSELA